MEKEKIILPIGNNKSLVFEADPNDASEQAFAKQCREVAATRPQSLQEFFTRLNDLQQKPPSQTTRKINRKI
jgi:hypothetical protein